MNTHNGQPPSFDISGASLDVAAIYRAMGEANDLTRWLDRLLESGEIAARVEDNAYHWHTADRLTHDLHITRIGLVRRLINRIRRRDPISNYQVTRITSEHAPAEE